MSARLMKTSQIIPISCKNIQSQKDTYNLVDGFQIRSINSTVNCDFIKMVKPPAFNIDDITLVEESNHFISQTFMAPKISKQNWDEWSKIKDERLMMSIRLIRTLLILKSLDIQLRPVIFFQRSINRPSLITREYIELYRIKGTYLYDNLTDNDLLDITKLYKRMKELVPKNKGKNLSKIAHSINFFWLARTTGNFDLCFITLVTSLEALLLTDIRELKHKLAERAALLLGDTTKRRMEIYKIISKTYKDRSKIVHGVMHLKDDIKTNEKIYELMNIIRKCIQKTLLNNDLFQIFGVQKKQKEKIEKYFSNLIFR